MDAERRKEEELVAACVKHTWREGDRSDLEKQGIRSEEQLKARLLEVVNHPDTRSFKGQPEMTPDRPHESKQFGREIHVLREGRKSIVVILDENRRPDGQLIGGSAWVGSGNQENRLLKDELKKMGLDKAPEVAIGGRPALQEREKHRQLVVQQKREPTMIEKMQERQREQPQAQPQQKPFAQEL